MNKSHTINYKVPMVICYILIIICFYSIIEYVGKHVAITLLAGMPVSVMEWSLLGGFCAVLYRLTNIRMPGEKKIANKSDLVIWMIVKPIIAIIMGMLTYSVLMGGNMVFNGVREVNNIDVLNVIVFIAGFSDTYSINYFYKLTNKISQNKK